MRRPFITDPNPDPEYQRNFYFHLQEYLRVREEDRRIIKKLGTCMGSSVLMYILIQNVLSFFIPLFGLSQYYLSSELFRRGIEILFVILSMIPAFMLFGKRMKKLSGVKEPVNLNKPKSALLTVLAFFAGMAVCMAANFVTSFFSMFMAGLGFELSSPGSSLPQGALGITSTVVQVVIVAAVVEEICLRGYVMGNLRRYGDGFAILLSSIMFALIHGNLIQAPFAFIAGLGLGYFSVKTNSLWTGILIHAGNNLFSVVLSYIGFYMGDEALTVIYGNAVGFFFVAGTLCFIAFIILTKNDPLKKSESSLPLDDKLLSFASSPAVIAVAVIMIIIIARYITPVGQVG